jgi:hypothetical protein
MTEQKQLTESGEDVVVIRPNRKIAWFMAVAAPFGAALGLLILTGIWPPPGELHWWDRMLRGPIVLILSGYMAYWGVWGIRTHDHIILNRDGISIPKEGQLRWSQIEGIEGPSWLSASSNVVCIRMRDGKKVYVGRILLEGGLQNFVDVADSMLRRYG